uniref:PDSTE3.3 mating-type pheromone receptor n=1 Tax=Pleurotus djamor TaxID=34470 RepID=Q68SU2_PLEDJ|nr:PDSTE3.3 mating-type pheromone receptor [Pleurotus djamor]
MSPELPAVAFLAAFLVLIPLPWHWRARNVSTCAMIAWLFVVNLIYGINAIIWADTPRRQAIIYCDIVTKVIVGASYALPLCTLCICKHLEAVSSNRTVSFDHSDKRRRIIFESIMCFGLPMIFMALHYIVQGHRFDIFEGVGCQATVYISFPAVFLIWFPQLLCSVVTLVYAALALYHFIRRRLTFAAHLQNSNSALTTNRYLRLIAMSITQMIYGTVLTSVNLYSNARHGLSPYTSWEDVHFNFSRIDVYPKMFIPPKLYSLMLLFWWTMPVSALIFFIFFGFGEEAKKEYSKYWSWIRRTIFRVKDNDSGKKGVFPMKAPPRFVTTSMPLWQSTYCPLHPLAPMLRKGRLLPCTLLQASLRSLIHLPKATQKDRRITPRAVVGLPSTPRPVYSNPIASTSTASCPNPSFRPTPSVESLPPRIELSPLHTYSPSTSTESLVDFNTAPPSFLTNKTSNFTLRSTSSVDRIYLVSQNSRPHVIRSPTPAPFRDLQDIPSEDDRSFYSGTASAASSRRPSVTSEGVEEVTRPGTPHPSAAPAPQRLADAIWVTVHTETRHGA